MVAADYAKAVAYLDRDRLPAYVSFVEQAWARGIGGDSEAPQRIYVRISDGSIVEGTPPANAHVVQTNNADSDNPFRKHPFFDPQCYVPKSENPTQWNGQPAVRFELQATCDQDSGISELYADPQTLRPIAVDGTMTDTGDSHMTVAIELRYATTGPYTVRGGRPRNPTSRQSRAETALRPYRPWRCVPSMRLPLYARGSHSSSSSPRLPRPPDLRARYRLA